MSVGLTQDRKLDGKQEPEHEHELEDDVYTGFNIQRGKGAVRAPFPYMGGKEKIAKEIWTRFGDIRNYIEPFAGSLACLLARPSPIRGLETVNDLNGYIVNAWRAIKNKPEETARYASWPIFECDLHARHAFLVRQKRSLLAHLEGDPEWCDPKLAGWWIWGSCIWIGGGWCSGVGPWRLDRDGKLIKRSAQEQSQECMDSVLEGVKRQKPSLASGSGVVKTVPQIAEYLRSADSESSEQNDQTTLFLIDWFNKLSSRLRRVRITNGDWMRVTSHATIANKGMTAVMLDPPYTHEERDSRIYTEDDPNVTQRVYDWCVENGDDPNLRIAYCSYGEKPLPPGWSRINWTAQGGYGNLSTRSDNRGKENRSRETVDFSPHCIVPKELQLKLFET